MFTCFMSGYYKLKFLLLSTNTALTFIPLTHKMLVMLGLINEQTGRLCLNYTLVITN